MTRALASLLVAAAILAGHHLHAAINLLGSSNARVDFGDVPMGGGTQTSVAVTVLIASPYAGATRFVSKWGNLAAEQSWVLYRPSGDEVNFLVANDEAFSPKYGCGTTDSPLSAGSLARIVAVIDISPKSCRIWVNGTERATSLVFDNSIAAILDSPTALQVGHETDESEDGVDGDYSEVAVWDAAVPEWFALAYGKGLSPAGYRPGGVFYAPLVNPNADGLRDVWGGTAGTNTSGTSAAHPSMYRPSE